MRFHWLGRSSPLASCVFLAVLGGCPQLLDDGFETFQRETQDASGREPEPPRDADSQDLTDAAIGRPSFRGPFADASTSDAGADALDAAPPASVAPDASSDAEAPADDPVLVALRGALVHRYRFDADAPLADSIGTAHATSVGVTFSAGAAVFAGTGEGQYLDLPNTLLAGLSSATFEAWVIWDVTNPGAASSEWQRIFDFGSNSSAVEGQQGSNANAIYLTPKSGGAQGKLHLEYRSSGNVNLDAPSALPAGVLVQVVAVVDAEAGLLSLYQDGALKGALSASLSLSSISYRNNWLGRSQYTENAPFEGRILDFRIYETALTSPLIQATFAAGPDADG